LLFCVYSFVFNFRSGSFQKNPSAPHLRKLFKNGYLIATDTPASHTSVNEVITVGTIYTSGTGFGLFGSVDEIRLYTRVLSDTELLNSHSNLVISIANLEAHYTFDRYTSTIVHDETSNGRHLTITGTPPPHFEVDVAGSSVCSNTVLTFAKPQILLYSGAQTVTLNGDLSISMWIRRSLLNGVHQCPFNVGASMALNNMLSICFRPTNELAFSFWYNDLDTAAPQIELNTWIYW
jgi:hypothetical protein